MKLFGRLKKWLRPPTAAEGASGTIADPRGVGLVEQEMTEQLPPEEEQPKDEES